MFKQQNGIVLTAIGVALLVTGYALYTLALGVQTVLAEQTGGWSAVVQGVTILLGTSLLLVGLLRAGPAASWGDGSCWLSPPDCSCSAAASCLSRWWGCC